MPTSIQTLSTTRISTPTGICSAKLVSSSLVPLISASTIAMPAPKPGTPVTLVADVEEDVAHDHGDLDIAVDVLHGVAVVVDEVIGVVEAAGRIRPRSGSPRPGQRGSGPARRMPAPTL